MSTKLFCFAVLAATTAAMTNPMFPDTGIDAGVGAAMTCFETAFQAAGYSWDGKYKYVYKNHHLYLEA